VANETLFKAAAEFSEWLEAFWKHKPATLTEDQQQARHQVFLTNWRYHRTRLERIVDRELRERALRLVMEGEPESKILAAIEKSNEARERYLTKVSAGSARRADKEKIRTARRKEERKQRKRKLGAWKEV